MQSKNTSNEVSDRLSNFQTVKIDNKNVVKNKLTGEFESLS
jgi:hypothetical protein